MKIEINDLIVNQFPSFCGRNRSDNRPSSSSFLFSSHYVVNESLMYFFGESVHTVNAIFYASLFYFQYHTVPAIYCVVYFTIFYFTFTDINSHNNHVLRLDKDSLNLKEMERSRLDKYER